LLYKISISSSYLLIRPILAANLRRRVLGQPLQPWLPQAQFLGIICTGDGQAVASKAGLGVFGRHMWRLKDKIDREWMAALLDFPDMDDMMNHGKTKGITNKV
jgi:selenide,water dikinase